MKDEKQKREVLLEIFPDNEVFVEVTINEASFESGKDPEPNCSTPESISFSIDSNVVLMQDVRDEDGDVCEIKGVKLLKGISYQLSPTEESYVEDRISDLLWDERTASKY